MIFRSLNLAALLLALGAGMAAAELREALPGTRYDWACTGDWRNYSEVIVEADGERLVKDAFVDGRKWSRTLRRSWLRGASLYEERVFERADLGRRVIDYDWARLKGFSEMRVGWSASGTAAINGQSSGRAWRDTLYFQLRHEARETIDSPVYGKIEVIRTTTEIRYGRGPRSECEALVFPDDAAQVEFRCANTGGRVNAAFACRLVDRY